MNYLLLDLQHFSMKFPQLFGLAEFGQTLVQAVVYVVCVVWLGVCGCVWVCVGVGVGVCGCVLVCVCVVWCVWRGGVCVGCGGVCVGCGGVCVGCGGECVCGGGGGGGGADGCFM